MVVAQGILKLYWWFSAFYTDETTKWPLGLWVRDWGFEHFFCESLGLIKPRYTKHRDEAFDLLGTQRFGAQPATASVCVLFPPLTMGKVLKLGGRTGRRVCVKGCAVAVPDDYVRRTWQYSQFDNHLEALARAHENKARAEQLRKNKRKHLHK